MPPTPHLPPDTFSLPSTERACVTLRIPDFLGRRLRGIAAKRQISVNELVTLWLTATCDQHDKREIAKAFKDG